MATWRNMSKKVLNYMKENYGHSSFPSKLKNDDKRRILTEVYTVHFLFSIIRDID